MSEPDVEVVTPAAITRHKPQQSALSVEQSTFALADLSDEQFALLVKRATTHADRMRTIVRELMLPGVHYIVPGESDPAKIKAAAAKGKVGISKAGAEMLLKISRYVAKVDYVIDYGDPANETSPAIIVRATATVYADSFEGPVMGVGVGTCTSWEVKYRYRNAAKTCPECGQATLRYQKEAKGGEFKGWTAYWCAPNRDGSPGGGCNGNFSGDDPRITGQESGKVANADTYDQLNTYVKMAAKRARVDGAIAATGSSDILTQDVEDLPEGEREKARREMVSAGADAAVDGMYGSDPDSWRDSVARDGAESKGENGKAAAVANPNDASRASAKQLGMIRDLLRKKFGATNLQEEDAAALQAIRVDLGVLEKSQASKAIDYLKTLPDHARPAAAVQQDFADAALDNEANRERLRMAARAQMDVMASLYPGRPLARIEDGIFYLVGANEAAIVGMRAPVQLDVLDVDQLMKLTKHLRSETTRKQPTEAAK